MQIEPNVLAPENYTNPRMVEVSNPETRKLYEKVREHQEKVNPKLRRYEEIEAKKAELKKPYDEYCASVVAELEEIVDFCKAEDQKASKVKEKLIPLVEEEVMPHLGELDEFVGLEVREDKLYAKVNDRIEEWVKTIREQKTKK